MTDHLTDHQGMRKDRRAGQRQLDQHVRAYNKCSFNEPDNSDEFDGDKDRNDHSFQ